MAIKLNKKTIKPTIFPDKTSQIWQLDFSNLLSQPKVINVRWDFENEAELIHLAQLKALLDSHFPHRSTVLTIPYLPYARQDKKVDNDLTFALRIFSDMINCQGWDSIKCYDVHNTTYCNTSINNFWNKLNVKPNNINLLFNKDMYDIFVFADESAYHKYSSSITSKNNIYGVKQRDQKTGEITHYELSGEIPQGKRVLVWDDLCDGGATFCILGESLKEMRVSADLYVSHGVFSKGVDHLLKYYNKIITTNTRVDVNTLKVMPYSGSCNRTESLRDAFANQRLEVLDVI